MATLCIQNANLCDHQGQRKADLRIQEGKISQIAPKLDPLSGEQLIDASSLTLLPSCIDLNVSCPSLDQLPSLRRKANLGGVGHFLLKTKTIKPLKLLDPYALPALISYHQGQVQEISTLARHRDENLAKSLAIQSDTPASALKCLYEYASLLSLPCTCTLSDPIGGVAIPSPLSYAMGIPSTFPPLEAMELSRFFALSSYFRVPTLLHALSDFDFFTKALDAPFIFTEISIHHLLLNEEKIRGYNVWAKLKPPLTRQENQEQLLARIQELDFLTSLHIEFPTSAKEQTFEDALAGVSALEFYFPLLYTELVRERSLLSLQELNAKTAYHPAKFLGLNLGEIAEGREAHLMLVDLDSAFMLSHPLYGEKELRGKVKALITPKELVWNP